MKLWRTVWKFFTNLSIELPYDPDTLFLRIYQKEMNTYVHRKTCIWMFIEALIIIPEKWEQSKCPLTDN
jgi:hypothetical protein